MHWPNSISAVSLSLINSLYLARPRLCSWRPRQCRPRCWSALLVCLDGPCGRSRYGFPVAWVIHRVCDAEHLRPQFDELIWQAYRAAELELCNYPSNYCSAKNSIKGILVYLTKDAYSLKKSSKRELIFTPLKCSIMITLNFSSDAQISSAESSCSGSVPVQIEPLALL